MAREVEISRRADPVFFIETEIWTASWQNQQNDCAPSVDSDQPGHPPSLIRVFAVRLKKARILSYPLSALRRLWSDWADAQADLSLRWAHNHFIGFVMRRLILVTCEEIINSEWMVSVLWINCHLHHPPPPPPPPTHPHTHHAEHHPLPRFKF